MNLNCLLIYACFIIFQQFSRASHGLATSYIKKHAQQYIKYINKNILNNFLIAAPCHTRTLFFQKLPSFAPAPESRKAPMLHSFYLCDFGNYIQMTGLFHFFFGSKFSYLLLWQFIPCMYISKYIPCMYLIEKDRLLENFERDGKLFSVLGIICCCQL